jgi:hypothetical protein
MPTPTYDLIATTTLAASTSEVVFGSLPQTYRDLILVITAKSSSANYPNLRFNGDSSTNYSRVGMSGSAQAGASSFATGSMTNSSISGYASTTSSDGYIARIQIMDYSATDKHKTTLTRADNAQTDTATDALATRWANTAAINTVAVLNGSAFSAGSTFSIYGVIS